MSLTYQEAAADMSAMFKTAWDTTGYKVFWQNVRDQRDTAENPWAEFFITHATGFQGSLGGVGQRTFNRLGIITVHLYVPIGKGLSESLSLAKLIADVYEGNHSPNGVWFRNVGIPEIGRDGEFHQRNVVVEFEYDEIK